MNRILHPTVKGVKYIIPKLKAVKSARRKPQPKRDANQLAYDTIQKLMEKSGGNGKNPNASARLQKDPLTLENLSYAQSLLDKYGRIAISELSPSHAR